MIEDQYRVVKVSAHKYFPQYKFLNVWWWDLSYGRWDYAAALDDINDHKKKRILRKRKPVIISEPFPPKDPTYGN